jgi:serine/threonine-protein kinase
MSTDSASDFQLEIGHVLFMDVVGYSKLLLDEQREQFRALNEIVSNTAQFRASDANGMLVRIPTGDGMALVFRDSVEAPVRCAVEISEAVKTHSEIHLRMGIHSGPVSEVRDVNERKNIAGAGIDIAQRVMDCGDAGHILLSRHLADDLAPHPRWNRCLHDLGECEVKHGARVSVVNFYDDQFGSAPPPRKFETVQRRRVRVRWAEAAMGLLVLAAIVAASVLLPRRPTSSALAAAGKSIAVLPFENFSADKENAYFADGVQDDILTALSKVADLKVISRTSVMSYTAGANRNLREIAQALGVSHVVEGSVRRSDGKVRVSAQLIDARTDAHLWADTYDRNIADVFAIQSDIAKAIVEQLRARLSPSEKAAIEEQPTKDITAHDLYVRAKLLNESSSFDARRLEKLVEATGLLDQAVTRDPDFLLAHCLLANTHGIIYFYGLDHTPARVALAEAAVNAAARLRPNAGETHLARAELFYRCYLDYDRARPELALAQRVLPNNAQVLALTSFVDRRQSRWNEAVRGLERALELDPRNWYYLQQLSLSYRFLRRYDEEAAALDRVIAILPDDVITKVARGWVEVEWKADLGPLANTIESILKQNPAAVTTFTQYYFGLGLYQRDVKAAENAIAAMPAEGLGLDQIPLPVPFYKGLVARMQGDSAAAQSAFLAARAEMERIVQEQPNYASGVCTLALIDAGLGRKQQAIDEARRACQLLPIAKDSINGVHMMEFLAVVYAWTGEKDQAIEQLRATLSYPGIISYGELKFHPNWDALRGDPRFEQIAASLAPKSAGK